MQQMAIAIIFLGLAIPVSRADDKPAKASQGFDALRQEFAEAQLKHKKDVAVAQKAVHDAKTDADKEVAQKKLDDIKKDTPNAKFAVRFLEFAEKNPDDPMVIRASMLAYSFSGVAKTTDPNGAILHEKIIDFWAAHCAEKPEINQPMRLLARLDPDHGKPLFRAIFERNPNPRMQAHAAKELANVTSKQEEKDKLNELLKGKYAEFFPDLSVGKQIPNVSTVNLEGKTVKTSDLKGKVVVLDIWETRCEPCRAMIPHEREMVERLKDKPFSLVSISLDAKKDTLTDFLAKEKMPWTHWWAGQGTGWIEDWDVQFIPTIYVLDARGVIRHKGLRGEDLEMAVNDLLKEVDDKGSSGSGSSSGSGK